MILSSYIAIGLYSRVRSLGLPPLLLITKFQHPSCRRGGRACIERPGPARRAPQWPARIGVWMDFRPLSSCRGPQAALKCSYHSDSVTRLWPVALRVRGSHRPRRWTDCPAAAHAHAAQHEGGPWPHGHLGSGFYDCLFGLTLGSFNCPRMLTFGLILVFHRCKSTM